MSNTIMGPHWKLALLLAVLGVCFSTGKSESVNNADSKKEIDRNAMGMSVLFDIVHFFLEDILHKDKNISDSFLSKCLPFKIFFDFMMFVF